MDNVNERLTFLFEKYYTRTATKQETDELFMLLHIFASEEQIAVLLKKVWNATETALPMFNETKSEAILKSVLNQFLLTEATEIQYTPQKKFSLWLKIAASVIIVVSLGVILLQGMFRSKPIQQQQVVKLMPQKKDVVAGGNKAILKLADGSTIALDHAENGVLVNKGNIEIRKLKDGQLQYIAKAGKSNAHPYSLNTISTPKGGVYQALLPDGTKVWLNSASYIKFPEAFSTKERRVEIGGEAYFEVAKNATVPFIVKTSKSEIYVLGTHFNVMNYDDELHQKTTLLTGSIRIGTPENKQLLKPGEQAIVNNSGGMKINKEIDVESEVSWKNGIFKFKDDSLEGVMRQIARWYDIDVVYQGKISEKQLNGSISRQVNLSSLVKMLNYSGINLKIEGKTVIVSNQQIIKPNIYFKPPIMRKII